MKERNPVTATETRFLDHKTDLVSLLPLPGLQSTTPVYSAIVIAATAILMPLLAFSMIAEFSGRLVVVTVVGGAAAAIAANYSTGAERLIDSRDGWRCATMYVHTYLTLQLISPMLTSQIFRVYDYSSHVYSLMVNVYDGFCFCVVLFIKPTCLPTHPPCAVLLTWERERVRLLQAMNRWRR